MNILFRRLLSLSIMLVCTAAHSQNIDSVYFSIGKVKGEAPIYDIFIKNLKSTPICLMHSVEISLTLDDTISLAVIRFQNSKAYFGLNKPAAETNKIYESTTPSSSYDAYIIMPHQELKFRIAAPKYNDDEVMTFEYIILTDFCFREFTDSISRNTRTWYERFNIERTAVAIPK